MAAVVSPAPRAEWRALFDADDLALPDQTPEFTDAVCAGSSSFDESRMYELEDGRRFVLPLLRRRFSPRGGSMPPALGMGGLVGPDADAAAASAVVADLKATCVSTRIRPNPLAEPIWAAASGTTSAVPMRAHVVPLDGGPDAVWSRMRRSGREGVKRARKAGLDVEVDRTGALLAEFRELTESSVRRWADQQREPRPLARWRAARRNPPGELEAMSAALGDRFQLIIARLDGRAIAGNIVLCDGNAHGTRAAMIKELAAPTRINYLLVWLQLEAAAAAGCRWFHMGESGRSGSIGEFKERFGAVAHDYHCYDVERIPFNRADRAARAVVKRVIRFDD